MTQAQHPADPPVIPLASGESGFDVNVIRKALASGGPAFFPRHRWFGDKARSIASVGLLDMAFAILVTGEPERIALTVVAVNFDDGGRERYFVPLGLVDDREQSLGTLAILETGTDKGVSRLVDGLGLPSFHAWLLNPVASNSVLGSRPGSLTWRPGPDFATRLHQADISISRVSGAEQSNSAVIFGHDLLVKVFRKLQPGLNPDIEISRFLTEQTTFRNFPELLGDLSYHAIDDQTYALGMALPFVPNLGDGWDYFQQRLRDMLSGTAVDLDLVAPLRRLGRRTGQFHHALATPTFDPAFAAEPITATDTNGWITNLTSSLERTLAAVRQHDHLVPAGMRDNLQAVTLATPGIAERVNAFAHLRGVSKIRVHGDYHLGQTLVTPDEDVVILDFEGEPSREMAERRAKTSPLKDVAGMLRSISYARAAALRALREDLSRPDAEVHLAAWEEDARDAFLVGYREETADLGATFIPSDPHAFAAALAAWELDKAVYEINYELNNRPDWLPLPLSALIGT